MKLSPFPQPFRYDTEWPHNSNPLNTQGCILSGWTVPWTCACPVHSNVSWVDLALLRVYLHFSKLSQWSGSPGFPEDNSSQKIIKQWRRHSVLQCFPCPLSPGILPNSMLALPSFPFAADIPVKALIICPQSHFHLFQLLSATVYISESQNHKINKVRKELWDHQV